MQIRETKGVLFLFSCHIIQIAVLARALSHLTLLVKARIIFKSRNEIHIQEC